MACFALFLVVLAAFGQLSVDGPSDRMATAYTVFDRFRLVMSVIPGDQRL